MLKIPLLKEYRLKEILIPSLICFENNRYDRYSQRNCVLNLYQSRNHKTFEHRDKSIFRGMVIPSLRHLELLYGSKDELRVGANGKLLINALNLNEKIFNEALKIIILELDQKIFRFTESLREKEYSKNMFIELISSRIGGKSQKQNTERINKWLKILKEVGVIVEQDLLRISDDFENLIKREIDANNKDFHYFHKKFFTTYKKLSKSVSGIVKIEDIRETICVEILQEKMEIITESIFDKLFSRIPYSDQEYMISLGKPMGAKEKLYEHKGSLYDTIFIKHYEKE